MRDGGLGVKWSRSGGGGMWERIGEDSVDAEARCAEESERGQSGDEHEGERVDQACLVHQKAHACFTLRLGTWVDTDANANEIQQGFPI